MRPGMYYILAVGKGARSLDSKIGFSIGPCYFPNLLLKGALLGRYLSKRTLSFYLGTNRDG